MEQNSIQLKDLKLNYYESKGSGHPIVLIHGNSSSGLTFEKQINGSLGDRHRVIAIDLPGHGDSDSFDDLSKYGMPGYAAAIAEAAEALGVQSAVFVGWSLGGHIVLEAHNLLPEAKGFAIYGTPPLAFPPAMEEAFLPNPAVNIGFSPEVTREQAEAYAASFFVKGVTAPAKPFVEDILRTDGNARAGLAGSIKPDGYQDEIIIAETISIPLAILHGVEEQLVSGSYIAKLTMPTLWRGKIQEIADSGHAPHWEKPEEFNRILAEFADEVAG